ncbi:MAG: hypothetical protein ACI9LO_002762 [Planctomycetota bacterium]|jgi:hypothetical protein
MNIYNRLKLRHKIALSGLLLGCLSVQASAGALYKWVDDDGQVRYSDRMPPEQKKKQHQQLNSQGVVLSTSKEKVVRSEESLAAEAEAKRKQEEQEKEEAAIREAQYNKDQVLLLTFSSEEELTNVRDNRIEVIDSVVRLIQKSISTNEEQLAELQASAELNYTSQGNPVPGGLAQKIEHFERKIESRHAQMGVKIAEKGKINQQFAIDRARFRELKAQ